MHKKEELGKCPRYSMTLSLDKKEFEDTTKWLAEIGNEMLLGKILGGVHMAINYKVQEQVLSSYTFLNSYSDVAMFKEGLVAMFNTISGGSSEIAAGK